MEGGGVSSWVGVCNKEFMSTGMHARCYVMSTQWHVERLHVVGFTYIKIMTLEGNLVVTVCVCCAGVLHGLGSRFNS